jgi:hypothetical protein
MGNVLGSIQVTLTANTSVFAAELDKAEAQARAASKKVQLHLKEIQTEAKHTQALFGEAFGITIPRHIRGFINSLPGVSKALSAAFTATAILVVIQVLVEAGKKVYELVEAFKAARENSQKFAEDSKKALEPLVESNDRLLLKVLQAQDALRKLQGRPAQNGAAIALQEAAIQAAELNKQLTESLTKLQEVMKARNVGMWQQVVFGKGGTKPVQEIAAYAKEQMESLPHDNTYDDRVKQLQKEVWNRAQIAIDNARKQTAEEERARAAAIDRRDSGITSDKAPIPIVRDRSDIIQQAYALQNLASDSYNAADWQSKLQQLNTQIEGQKTALEERKKLAEDSKKLDDEERKQLEENITRNTDGHKRSIAEELLYIAQLKGVRAANQQWLRDKKADLQDQQDQQDVAALQKFYDEQERAAKVASSALREYNRALYEGIKLEGSAQEKQVEWQEHIGALSHAEATWQKIQVRAEQYQKLLEQIRQERLEIESDASLTPEQKKAKLQENTNRKTAADDDYKLKRQQDEWELQSQKAKAGMDDFFREVVRQSENSAAMVKSLMSQALSGFNDELAKAMAGEKTSWGSMFKSLQVEMNKKMLESMEGELFKALGLGGAGKKGDSRSNPIFTQDVNDYSNPEGKSGIGGILGIIGKVFGLGGSQGSEDGTQGGGWGGFIKGFLGTSFGLAGSSGRPDGSQNNPFYVVNSGSGSGGGLLGGLFGGGDDSDSGGGGLFGFGGFFAEGGDITDPNKTYIVGERGAELFTPGVRGSVTPNHKLNSLNGGHYAPTYNIDARGTNPAEVDARVRRATAQSRAQAVSEAMVMQREYDTRRPQYKRAGSRF